MEDRVPTNLVTEIRNAWVEACASLEREQKPLTMYLRQAIENDPLQALNAIAKFVPKEMLLQGDPQSPFNGNFDITIEFKKAGEPSDS